MYISIVISGKIPWMREWQPIPIFLPGESFEQKSLGVYSWQYCRVRYNWSNIACITLSLNSVAQLWQTLCDPMECSTPGLPVHHQLPELTQTHVHWVGDAIQHLILCRPLLLLPSIFPSIRVFSNDSALHIRWPKYWSFSFNMSPSTEHPGLISFRRDWLDLLQVQGTLKSLLQHYSSKASIFGAQLSLYSNSQLHTWLQEKP